MITLKNFNRGILTRYFGPSNSRGARIAAIDGDRRVYVSYSYGLSGADCHFKAVEAYLKKYGMDWGTSWGYTSLEKGDGYIFFAVPKKEK